MDEQTELTNLLEYTTRLIDSLDQLYDQGSYSQDSADTVWAAMSDILNRAGEFGLGVELELAGFALRGMQRCFEAWLGRGDEEQPTAPAQVTTTTGAVVKTKARTLVEGVWQDHAGKYHASRDDAEVASAPR